ncbi:MAG: type II toxin-antitoxin system RelE/ParE family toxin [Candidatus Cloacimonetes bacterium]|nr:type II toxin-antitoxin system RelE/ParE family toxin [Candidatus Cloacimonadota bacterium]
MIKCVKPNNMYEIEYSKKVMKFLDKLDEKIYQRIRLKLLLLQKNPFDTTLNVKKMKNLENTYRLRIGKIRILYKIYKDKILIFVFNMKYRGNIYK